MTTSGTEIYAAFIEAELKAENDRRESLHTRAAAIATGAAGLVTLALGVFGLLVAKNHEFPDVAKPFFVAAVICLLALTPLVDFCPTFDPAGLSHRAQKLHMRSGRQWQAACT